jgi:hypothetical protein
MAIYPKDMVSAIKTALSTSSELTYVDTVAVLKYTPEALPNFSTYCIVINPVLVLSMPYEAAQRWFHLQLELVLLAKMGTRSDEDALLANSPPANVGILTMYEDVYKTLYGNDMGGVLELYPHLEELDYPSPINIVSEERDSFIMEARVDYRPRGQRWVDLS